jgi:hypothetical protein
MMIPTPIKRGFSRMKIRAGVFVLATFAPFATWAVCVCGFQDGLFTLATITLDGDISDWGTVLSDPDNNVCDGPAGGLTDRDSPQSTGRDLVHFAYTWDQNSVYLYTERHNQGQNNNTQSFVYYADTNNDGLMSTDEPVIGVRWNGQNSEISVYIYTYVAQANGGDPLVDGNGFGDGYTLPGSFANVPSPGNPDHTGTWGSSDGYKMEFPITWAELGLSAGDPFSFHVASSNAALGANSFTAQIDDNLSGCGGGAGSTVIPAVEFIPDQSLSGFAGDTVVGTHTLTNTGNSSDFFDLSSVASGDFTPTISYYQDVDSSGTVTAGDLLLTDTDGDTNPDTPVLVSSESIAVLVVYDIPGGVSAGEAASIATIAASDYQPLANDIVTDTIDIPVPPELLVTKQVTTVEDPINLTTNPKAIPGSEVLYTVTVANQGSGTVDTDAFYITDVVPANGCINVLDAGAVGSGPVAYQDGSPSSNLTYTFVSLSNTTDDLEFSSDGGASFSYVPVPGTFGCDALVTHIRINPKGTFAADTGAGSPQAEFSFRVFVN